LAITDSPASGRDGEPRSTRPLDMSAAKTSSPRAASSCKSRTFATSGCGPPDSPIVFRANGTGAFEGSGHASGGASSRGALPS
jgi:hypothetical protein